VKKLPIVKPEQWLGMWGSLVQTRQGNCSINIHEPRFESDDLNTLFRQFSDQFGFDMPRPTQCTITPALWTDGQEIKITTQKSMSFGKPKNPQYYRRNFSIFLEEEPWNSGEVLTLASMDQNEVWDQLRRMHDLPDLSHFKTATGDVGVTGLQKWPAGSFRIFPVVFSVEFEVEVPTGRSTTLNSDNMTAGHAVEQAWEMLRMQTVGMYEHATFTYRGYLQPGLKIQAEVRRERVQLTVVFEIRYGNQAIWNMWTQEDIWNHFFTFDIGLLPIERYEAEDKRPWYPNTVIFFRVKESDVPSRTCRYVWPPLADPTR
jgi:hypothetical protein